MASEFFAPLPPTAPPEPIPFLVTSSGANASPGPAATSTRGDPLVDVPKTYLKGRHPDRNDVNTAPYRDIGSTIGKGKRFTLKGRCEEPMPESGPSPDYVPPPFGSGARAATVHTKTQESTKESTPVLVNIKIVIQLVAMLENLHFMGQEIVDFQLEKVRQALEVMPRRCLQINQIMQELLSVIV